MLSTYVKAPVCFLVITQTVWWPAAGAVEVHCPREKQLYIKRYPDAGLEALQVCTCTSHCTYLFSYRLVIYICALQKYPGLYPDSSDEEGLTADGYEPVERASDPVRCPRPWVSVASTNGSVFYSPVLRAIMHQWMYLHILLLVEYMCKLRPVLCSSLC